MKRGRIQSDYLPVKRSRAGLTHTEVVVAGQHSTSEASSTTDRRIPIETQARVSSSSKDSGQGKPSSTFLKRGHFLSYAALFLFTTILYARPAEFYPSPLTASIALIVGLITLAFFVPIQLSLEGNLSASPPEIKLVLLFALAALLSIPLAINPSEAWYEFSGAFIRCIVMFVVLVNVVRTEARLKGLLFLALLSSIWLSLVAINDYRLGLLTVGGYRASGVGAGIFGNTNDMALHAVTILPISIALFFGARGWVRKLLYGGCAALMFAAVVLSYSRGAFVGMVVLLTFLAFRLGRSHKLEIVLIICAFAGAILLLAPGYGVRVLSIIDPSLDPNGSADARRGELFRSIYVSLRHPLLGIGMGNYGPEMSYRGQVTHNAYTQVAAEMGMAALVCYTTFIVAPLKKLGQIARETFEARDNSHFYYMAVGLQASLIGYMVSSFFLSVAYSWYVYYLVGYAVCLRRLYESEAGKLVVAEKRNQRKRSEAGETIVVNAAVLT